MNLAMTLDLRSLSRKAEHLREDFRSRLLNVYDPYATA